jgi:hypothetical protein
VGQAEPLFAQVTMEAELEQSVALQSTDVYVPDASVSDIGLEPCDG